MTRTLAILTLTTIALLAGGCASTYNDANSDWQITYSGPVSQPSYATGDTIAPSSPNHSDSGAPTSSQPYLLDSGDRVRITVYGEPDLSMTYMIDHEGTITVPLIGGVEARGRSLTRLSRSIANRLGATYIREPQVTANLDQYRPIYILGGVHKSGQYPYVSGMTVEAAVATAGGFKENANQHTMRLTRRIEGTTVVADVPSQFAILPGDSIYVSEGFLSPFDSWFASDN